MVARGGLVLRVMQSTRRSLLGIVVAAILPPLFFAVACIGTVGWLGPVLALLLGYGALVALAGPRSVSAHVLSLVLFVGLAPALAIAAVVAQSRSLPEDATCGLSLVAWLPILWLVIGPLYLMLSSLALALALEVSRRLPALGITVLGALRR